MTVATTAQHTFATEAVQAIWREVTKAAELGNFIGVTFDDPYSSRKAIWISYARSPNVYIGQDERYESRLWPDFYTAFELLYNRFRRDGYGCMVQEVRDRRFRYPNQPDEINLTLYFGGRDAHPEGAAYVRRCLRRVDNLMVRLEEPLDD